MSNLGAKRYAFGSCVEQKTMGQRKVIRTTLGELVVAVTDEVMPIIRGSVGPLQGGVFYLVSSLNLPSGARSRAVTTKIPRLFG